MNTTQRIAPPAAGAAAALLTTALLALAVPAAGAPLQEPDYEGIWARGVTFEAFLESADQQAAMWRDHYREGDPDPAAVERAGAIAADGLRLLVVAEDWCSDSVDTIPYAARIVEAIEGLQMRIVDSGTGAEVMSAHPTPDGRGATPTVVLLDGDGNVLGAWIERPAELQDWFLANRDALRRRELMDQKRAWYVEDHGRSTVSELLDLIENARPASH